MKSDLSDDLLIEQERWLLVKMAFLLHFILQAHFLQLLQFGLIVQVINKLHLLLLVQEVLLLLFLMMNRLFTCKIKEHNEI